MPFTGVSHKVGEHIDTDAIIPARFLVTTDPKKLGENCMEGLEHGWVKRVQVGDILVAERMLMSSFSMLRSRLGSVPPTLLISTSIL